MRSFLQKNKDKAIHFRIEPGLLLTKCDLGRAFLLKLNGEKWMVYHPGSLYEEREFTSSVELAYGKCVLSGLGFGILAGMLLENPKVSSITVYEVSKEVIEMNRLHGESFKKIEVIHKSIRDVRGITCDCLLLDHYEKEKDVVILNDVIAISENIDANCIWFWRAEPMIQRFKDKGKIANIEEAYNLWVTQTGLTNLPKFTKKQLTHYIDQWQHYNI